jgi:hypothetical protein
MLGGASTSCELGGSLLQVPHPFAGCRCLMLLLPRTANVTIHQSCTVKGAFLVRYGERADFCGGVRLVNTVSGSPAYI